MKNVINRALAAKKVFSILAISTIVLGMASCGDGVNNGNEPEPEVGNFQFKINALPRKAQVIVTPSKKDAYFYTNFKYESEVEEIGLDAQIKDQFRNANFDDPVLHQNTHPYMIRDLNPETKLFAYAFYAEKGEDGKLVIVGDIAIKEFKTLPEYILNGEFTVDNAGKKVHFYSSNLAKYPDGKNFFSNNQWWSIGVSASNRLHDLFQWTQLADPNMAILTAGEWEYLFRKRPHAEERFAHATISDNGNKKHGLILLPDNWQTPDGIELETDYDMNIKWDDNGQKYENYGFPAFEENDFDLDQWEQLEFAGAVFLPAAGLKIYDNDYGQNLYGEYWSSTIDSRNPGQAHEFDFGGDDVSLKYLISSGLSQQSYLAIRPVRAL